MVFLLQAPTAREIKTYSLVVPRHTDSMSASLLTPFALISDIEVGHHRTSLISWANYQG